MPLHGKIVVVKRSGGDGTEFPLTATCLFGRKPDCDIRIQLPQVSKEHCRIDLNENKEVILTNLSSVNPTRVNGEVLQQSERLKHGDVITIIDRSFRFEYPPAPTPKKRSSIRGKPETFKVLQDQQVGDTAATETAEKRTSQVSTDPPLKDGTNQDNIQRSLEKTVELESKEDDGLLQNKPTSPFNDLYQMIKKSLDVKTPRKSCASLLQTPTSRFCTPKPDSVRKSDGKPPIISTEEKGTPKKDEAKMSAGAGETEVEADISNGNPKSVKKQRRSFQVPSEMARPEADNAAKTEASSPLKKNRATPQKFTVCEVIEQVCAQTPKSPMRRRSKEATPAKPAMTSPKTEHLQKTSPRNSGKVEKVKEASKKRKSGELAANLPTSEMKKKRVSFGGHLSPELFDKRLPPDSPLRKGATPRRSLCLFKPKQSLLRRASVIGLLQEFDHPEHPDSPNVQRHAKMTTPSPKKPSGIKNASPKTPSPGKKSPKSSSPSPKAATPAKKSPKSRTPSPKAATPAKKSPKSSTSSPKAATPAKKSPKSSTPSPKATTLGAKSPKSKSPSPARARSPSGNQVETPRFQTPTVQGRFSVSRINTPSPVVEDGVTDQVAFVTVTPKIPLKRKSMKSTSRKTPRISKSALTVMRRSGISRASIKATSSFADIVKFGQTKAQVAAPPKKTVTKKTMKKAVSKSQTPARKLKDHVTTGHAESPVTIVVGRAHKQKVVYPTGAAPKLVINTAFLKKNMKMDEDLTGISEMYKTPVNERKRRSVINDSSAMKTPLGALGSSVVEPSVLNTPEEPDEMMVSPLSVSSTIKDRRYNSEAVQRLLNGDEEPSFISDTTAMETRSDCSSEQQCTDLKTTSVTTPKQKPEQQECLTGVKRIMKTPRQRAEPVEDLRGKLLKTPKQKPEQQECLTGVKRIMKTPRQRAEPVEDLRGTLLKTPKRKPEQQECLTGVKRIFKTPQQEAETLKDLCEKLLATPKALEAGDMSSHGAKEIAETSAHMQESEMKTPNVKRSPLVGLTGIKRIMTTPKEKSAPVEDLVGVKRLMKTPREKSEPVEENFGIKRLLKSPRLRGNAAVEDFEGLQELMEEPLETNEVEHEMPLDCDVDVAKEVDANEVAVDDHLEEVPSAQDMAGKVSEVDTTATDPDHKKKSVRGRRAKTVESKVAKDAQEATEPEDPVVSAPVRGRRGKKTEATAPPAARQTTRGRNAKTAESKDAEVAVEESASLPSKVALKSKRGRNVKKASDDQEVAAETAIMPEPESEQSPPADVDHDSAAPLEKAVVRPKRGRKTRQPEQSVPEQQDAPSTHSDSVLHADLAKEDAMETVPQSPANTGLPEVETTCKVAEIDEAIVQKKSVRGRRAKTVEPASAEDQQEVAEHSEDPVVAASVRGRRGKKTEATTPPAARQTTRGSNTKSQERLETLATKISTELVSGHTSPIKTQEEEHDSAPPAEKAVVKPTRGRKTKQTPVELPPPEPERNEAVSEEHLVAEAQPQKSTPTPVKSRRGRKTKPDTVEQKEAAEETVVTVETKQQSRPTVRAKRGRNAKQEEEKLENDDKSASVETTKPQEPVKKLRRTRNAEQDPVETREDGQTVKMVVPEEDEVPFVVEPVSMNEQATVAAKPRRGGRKAKQDTESATPVEPTEVPALSSADKPKRGRRGKQVAEEVEVSAEVPEEKPVHELDAEEKNNAEPDAPVVKRGRARGVKNEVSQATPAKRARRGAALEETNAEPTVPASESASTSAEPTKRGRRAAAKPATDDATVTSNQADPTEDLSHAVVEDMKTSKRAVKWKTNLEVFEIPKVTPVKAVRGRKSKPEEKDLSDKAIEARPVEKARRGAKAVVVTTDEATSKVKSAEAETQPKTRRGRSAKK